MSTPLYRPNPSIGEDDGLHFQAITESLVKPATMARDYDSTANMMLLVPMQSLLRRHKMLCEELDRKIERMLQSEMKANRANIRRGTAPKRKGSPFKSI